MLPCFRKNHATKLSAANRELPACKHHVSFELQESGFAKECSMPLIHVYLPVGTLAANVRDHLAEELTAIALEVENLPTTPFDKSAVWIYFHEVLEGAVYHGGKPGGTRVITVDVNAFEGGHDNSAKRLLYQRFTEAIGKHLGSPEGARVPVYILLRQVHDTNWGVFGRTTTIHEVRTPHPTEPAI